MRVLVHYDHPEIFLDLLTDRYPDAVVECCRSYDALASAIEAFEPEILFVIKFEDRPYPRDAVMASPTLRWVSVGGAGVDHLTPWDPAHLVVTNGAGVTSEVIATYVVGAMISLAMKFPHFARQQAARQWSWDYVEDLSDQTLAIVGLGHVGQAVARKAAALNMRVIGTRARPRPTPAVERVYPPERLHDALAQGDFVAVCAPLLPGTRHLIDRAAFGAMKQGCRLIDVSRGSVVDGAALIDALGAGKLGGAMLDVFENEPLDPASPLWSMDNVMITPHSSAVFKGWERRTFQWFCDNLERWNNGTMLSNVVDPARGY